MDKPEIEKRSIIIQLGNLMANPWMPVDDKLEFLTRVKNLVCDRNNIYTENKSYSNRICDQEVREKYKLYA